MPPRLAMKRKEGSRDVLHETRSGSRPQTSRYHQGPPICTTELALRTIRLRVHDDDCFVAPPKRGQAINKSTS